MKFLLLAVLGLVCAVHAKDGSISEHLFDDDIKDTPHAEEDGLVEPADILEDRRRNPCFEKKCLRGERCVLTEQKEAECVCVTDCSFYEKGPRYRVCSNHNKTYSTECSLNADHCLCKRGDPGCSQPGVERIYLDYFGECQEQLSCPQNEAEQFPRRMREWLFIVMEDMARRARLGQYSDLVEKAAQDTHHAFAVIWKFCDLDQDPQDRKVTKRELQYTVRSLRSLEGCLVPFLDGCDANDDKRITLEEWGHCLELQDDEIVDKCVAIHEHKPE